jgi:hypothetical protein
MASCWPGHVEKQGTFGLCGEYTIGRLSKEYIKNINNDFMKRALLLTLCFYEASVEAKSIVPLRSGKFKRKSMAT